MMIKYFVHHCTLNLQFHALYGNHKRITNCVKLTTHLHPSSADVKKCVELYFNSPSTSSWRDAYSKASTLP